MVGVVYDTNPRVGAMVNEGGLKQAGTLVTENEGMTNGFTSIPI